MEAASNLAEVFLVRLDPARVLEQDFNDLERLSKLDPKLGAAKDMLAERFGLLPSDSIEPLAAVLWTYSRTRTRRAELDGFRTWLDNGHLVLRTVEDALGSVFSVPVLQELIRHGTEMAGSDSAPSTDLHQARVQPMPSYRAPKEGRDHSAHGPDDGAHQD